MKKYDAKKTYNVAFKNEDSEQLMFIHFHNMIADEKPSNGAIHQVMSLWNYAKWWGQTNGGFINQVKKIDPKAMDYLEITEKKEGEDDEK